MTDEVFWNAIRDLTGDIDRAQANSDSTELESCFEDGLVMLRKFHKSPLA